MATIHYISIIRQSLYMKKTAIFLSFGALMGLSSYGQSFSGHWTLQQRTSLSGIDYGNGVPKDVTMNQGADSITITRITAMGQNPDVTATETISENGAVNQKTTSTNRNKTAVFTWTEPNKSFNEKTTLSSVGNPSDLNLQIDETWSLSPDGNTLTLVKDFKNLKNSSDMWSQKGVYTRSN